MCFSSHMWIPSSKSKCKLQLQAVQVRLAAADGVVQLRFKGDVVVEVVASAERRPVAQTNIVVDQVVGARVHILITEERPHWPELLGELRIERGCVEDGRTTNQGVPDQKPLIQEFKAVSEVDNVSVNNRLIVPGRLSRAIRRRRNLSTGEPVQKVIADLVVVVGGSDLQSPQCIGPSEKSDVGLIAVIFIGRQTVAVEVRADGVTGPILRDIVQVQPPGWNLAGHGSTDRLRGK